MRKYTVLLLLLFVGCSQCPSFVPDSGQYPKLANGDLPSLWKATCTFPEYSSIVKKFDFSGSGNGWVWLVEADGREVFLTNAACSFEPLSTKELEANE